MDAAPKEKIEIVIGTDPLPTPSAADAFAFQGPPDAATVQRLLNELHVAANNQNTPIEAMEFDTIATVNDYVDRLASWCTESVDFTTLALKQTSDDETHNEESASQSMPHAASFLVLSHRESIESALRSVFEHNRPKLSMNGFRCLAQYIERLAEFQNLAKELLLQSADEASSTTPNNNETKKLQIEEETWDGVRINEALTLSRVELEAHFLPSIVHMLLKFPNADGCVVEGLAAASSAALFSSESVICSDTVAVALGVMKSHPTHSAIIREGCRLLRRLVAHGQREDPQAIPVAVLLANIGVTIDFLVLAAQHFPDDTVVCDAVAETLSAMSRYPGHNLDAMLVDHQGVVKTLCDVATRHVLAPRIVRSALSALSPVPPELDDLQSRSLALRLRVILTKTVDTEVLSTTIALLLAILRNNKKENEEGGGGPPSNNSNNSMQMFFVQSMIPQMIAVALDHFGDVDEVLKRVAETAISEMMVYKYR